MSNTDNSQVRCLLVDDEPMARDVLRRYIERVPSLHLSGECASAIEALVFLQNNEIDLIFLDIRMPELLGTEFVQSLKNPPKIIFTTAFKEYALDGFELDAVDYLLKPVRFERFIRAVNKAYPKNADVTEHAEETPRKTGTDFIFLRVDKKLVKILLSDILYIESAKDYVKVFTGERYYITRQTISSVEAMLTGSEFVRIHRSYIISIKKIKSYNTDTVEIGSNELPIGKYYRSNFEKFIG